MDEIVEVAHRHGIAVIEDCAHALGATYHDRPVGTLGDAAFFSLQTIKPLNAYGGGMAVVRDPDVARRVADIANAAPLPDVRMVKRKLWQGRVQRVVTQPPVFTWTMFPLIYGCRRQPELRCVPFGRDPAARPPAAQLPRALFQRAGGHWARRARAPRPLACHNMPPCGADVQHPASGARRAPSNRAPGFGRTRSISTAFTYPSVTRSSIAACSTGSTSRRYTWTSAPRSRSSQGRTRPCRARR